MKKRILSLVISMVMLLTPVFSLGEEMAAACPAGALMPAAVIGAYSAGGQVDLDVKLALAPASETPDEVTKAVVTLLDKFQLSVSAHPEEGAAAVYATVDVDPVNLLTANVRLHEDSAVEAMTSFTGNYVLTLPAGALEKEEAAANVSLRDFDLESEEGLAVFRALPAMDRIKLLLGDGGPQMLSKLMGWVTMTQMTSGGQLFAFDETPVEATENRGPVARRMVIKVKAASFAQLLSTLVSQLGEAPAELPVAIADLLAEAGITRAQAQMAAQAIFAQEEADPAAAMDESLLTAPVQGEDVALVLQQLTKLMEVVCANPTENEISIVISFGEQGGLAGVDVDLQQFTTLLPFAFKAAYSSKADENAQLLHNVQLESQINPENKVVVNADVKLGQDVNGKNDSYIIVAADMVNQNGFAMGVGLNANLGFEMVVEETGVSELLAGGLVVNMRMNGSEMPMFGAELSGKTIMGAEGFNTVGKLTLPAGEMGMLTIDVAIASGEPEAVPFTAVDIIDVTQLDEAAMATIQTELDNQVMRLGMQLINLPDVMGSLLAVLTALNMN